MRQIDLHVLRGFGHVGHCREALLGRLVEVGVERVGHRHHQQVPAEHVFVIHPDGFLVFREIHHEGAHDAAAFLCHRAAKAIDVRQETVAQLDELLLHVESPITRFAELVNFRLHGGGAVVAHDGHEAAPLHPAHLQFLHGHVLPVVVVFPSEEAADVRVPVGDAAERVVQSARDLAAHHVPLRHHVAAPAERAVALLAEVRRTGHEEQPLAVRHGALVLIHAHVAHEGEGVVYAAEGAVCRGQAEVGLGHVEAVRFGGIGPPSIDAQVVEVFQVTPVEVAGLGVERVVGMYAPVARPAFERQEGAHGFQFLVLVGPGAEVGPYGNHDMRVVLVHVVNHLLRTLDSRFGITGVRILVVRQVFHPLRVAHLVDVARVHELHGVPVRVASPILPVLHDAVQGHSQFAVPVQHLAQFVRTFVAFAALPVAHRPKREHGGLPRQLADAGDDTVLGAVFIYKVIVAHQSGLAVEARFLRGVGEHGGRRVVPIESVAFLRSDVGDAYAGVFVAQHQFLPALVQFPGLLLSEAVNGLVGLQHEPLADAVAVARAVLAGYEVRAELLLLHQQVAPGILKSDFSGVLVHDHFQVGRLHGQSVALFRISDFHIFRCQDDRIAFLFGFLLPGILDDTHNVIRIETDFLRDLLRVNVIFHATSRAFHLLCLRHGRAKESTQNE